MVPKERSSVVSEELGPDERSEERVPDTAAGEASQSSGPLENHGTNLVNFNHPKLLPNLEISKILLLE